jgi:cytosine/adenosine deaminase-related metal-dependent hydrolase
VSDQINDLIVRGRVVTMDAQRSIIDDGAVVVRDGTIVAIGPWGTVEREHKAKHTMGRPGKFVLPGFIDTHTHCTQCFVRSLTTGELPMIPRIYVPAQRSLSPEQAMQTVRLIA